METRPLRTLLTEEEFDAAEKERMQSELPLTPTQGPNNVMTVDDDDSNNNNAENGETTNYEATTSASALLITPTTAPSTQPRKLAQSLNQSQSILIDAETLQYADRMVIDADDFERTPRSPWQL